jgi:signal transduction histidine kinase
MSDSLAGRLTVLQQGMALAVIVVFAGSALWFTARALERQGREVMDATARRIARSYNDERKELPDPVRAAGQVVAEGATPGVTLEIRDASGRLLAGSRTTLRPSAGAARDTVRADEFVATARTADGATVRASMSGALHRASIEALARALVIAALPLLALSLLLGRGIARRALRPLSTMADRAERFSIESGARSLGGPTGLEEIDRLGRSFDRLLERLDDALRVERQLTADASHELRTPLTVLSGELEIARSRVSTDLALAANLSGAADQVLAMRELVDAILLLHRSGVAPRPGDAAFEPVNLCDLVRDVTAEAELRYRGRHADLTVEAPDEVLVPGHPALLTSAVRNLVDNALKFTRPGQSVRIAVDRNGGQAAVVVEDGGAGVPLPEHDRIFDPFYRGAEARAGGSGFGLGLPILRRVARVHGGDVEVGASKEGGARFVLTIPLMQEEA